MFIWKSNWNMKILIEMFPYLIIQVKKMKNSKIHACRSNIEIF